MSAPFYQPGPYVCEVTSQALGESKTGNPQFILRFKVLGTPIGGGEYELAKQQYERTHYRSITDKTAEYFVQDLKALGFEKDSFRYLDPSTPGSQCFVGNIVTMTCTHENDQTGQSRERWGIARQGGELNVKPLEPKKLRQLDTMFGKHLKSFIPPNGVPVASASPSSVEITDDDIPF